MSPAREARQEPLNAADWPRSFVWAAGVCLLAGLGWRLTRYLLQFPIWGDEGMVLVDVRECGYYALTQPLPIFQVAPVLFLWLERAMLDLAGGAELAVRLPSFVAGAGALLLFAWMAWRRLEPTHGALAIAILAASYWPVRHACEAKPYALDLLAAVGLLVGTVGWLHDRQTRWLVALLFWVPIALLGSYPAVFVAGAMSVVMATTLRHASWSARVVYGLFNIAIVLTFLGHYYTVARNQVGGPQVEVRSDSVQAYWSDSFPPSAIAEVPWWLVKAHAGGLFAYPVGGSRWGGSASFMLAMLGAWHLWTCRRRRLLLACALPFALTLGASVLHKYPYGGSPRVAQHLAPMACLLIAAGGAFLVQRIRGSSLHAPTVFVLCLALAGFAAVGAIRDWRRPYKTEYDRTVRDLVHTFQARLKPGEQVIICNELLEVIVNYQWYLCRDRSDVAWANAAQVGPTTTGVWLLRFGFGAADPAALRSQFPSLQTWSMAECEQLEMPKEYPEYCDMVWTRIHLVPSR
jgi:hypothetical protein